MIAKIISGFITGSAIGYLLTYPTTFVLDKFLPLSEKWFPDMGMMIVLFIFVPFGYGLVGALLVATIDICKPLFKLFRYGLIILIIIVNLYGLYQLEFFERIFSLIPGFSTGTIPATKSRLKSIQKNLDFPILAPSRLPKGLTKEFGAGAFDTYTSNERNCNSISFSYNFEGQPISISESKAGVSFRDCSSRGCSNYMLVSQEDYDEVKSKMLQSSSTYVEDLNLNGINVFIVRFKTKKYEGKLDYILFIKYGTIVRISGIPKECNKACENAIFDLARHMEPIVPP